MIYGYRCLTYQRYFHYVLIIMILDWNLLKQCATELVIKSSRCIFGKKLPMRDFNKIVHIFFYFMTLISLSCYKFFYGIHKYFGASLRPSVRPSGPVRDQEPKPLGSIILTFEFRETTYGRAENIWLQFLDFQESWIPHKAGAEYLRFQFFNLCVT